MREQTLGDILHGDFRQEPLIMDGLEVINTLDAPLPPQVERTCEIFEKQFTMTADRLDSIADKLELFVADLRLKARNIRAASSTVPRDIRDWVLTERSYAADCAFYDPITK